ncbi:MAG: PEP-CTERM sorting domain-containing protein [Planctomycetota bacterium]
MKRKFGLFVAAGLSLAVSHSASAAIVANFDFDTAGQPEGWTLTNALRSVNGNGFLRGNVTVGNNDPQMRLGETLQLTRTAGSTAWDELVVVVSEYDAFSNNPGDAGNLVTSTDTTGVTAIFNLQAGTPNLNVGEPTASAVDSNGFVTLTWDISGLTTATTGTIRIDPVGGPDTGGNSFFVDSITFTDNNPIPEPASLMLVGLGGLAMLTRRRS